MPIGFLRRDVLDTFASRLVMAGMDIRTVQELMGHKTIAMTLRYSHLSPNHKRKAIQALETQFSEKSPINFHNTPISPPFRKRKKPYRYSYMEEDGARWLHRSSKPSCAA